MEPTSANQESFTGFVSSHFEIGSLVCITSDGPPEQTQDIGLRWSPGAHGMSGTNYTVHEVNGCLVADQVDTPASGGTFISNNIEIGYAHFQGSTNNQVGTSSTTFISSNVWRLTGAATSGQTFLSTYASGDLYIISNVGGAMGISWQASAMANTATVASNLAITPVKDNLTSHSSVVVGTGGAPNCTGQPSTSFAVIGGVVTHC